ncbi:MFS transporter [Shewanella amazonensis]|uniref:Putative MFS transporter family protein n=1 Tax=Shewanella amazonensis (strain ATCC BAA-1098 / SB2B) TaxID=326297 RepID=A1S9J3_SHEAM|nr:MFS transporter [Shewanella amazonensis]ABM01050.1 putative MFS transporter family protein [Shewanella amazonensis SB2B]
MQSDISLARVKQFPRLMWILLFGSFITRGSYYMVWPFLAVILYERFGLSATNVGLILSSAALLSVLVSFIGSALSDRIGRQKMMYGAGVLYIISFSLLAEADSVAGFALVITLCSIATSLWRPLVSALIGDIIHESQTRELAMQSLYFIVNVGCAVGPIAGVWLGLTGEQSSFYITTVAFAILLLLLWWGFVNHEFTQATHPGQFGEEGNTANSGSDDQAASGMRHTLRVLASDRLLQSLILANVICMFIFGQMDGSLVQYLSRAGVPNVLELISSMIFANAMIIITCQFLLLKLMAHWSLVKRIQVALVLLIASQLWMGLNPVDLFWGWIGAVIVMSLAEAVLFPTMNVHIDRIAPRHLRGAYFGASSFYEFGFALAPLGGGIVLDLLNGSWLFLGCAALTLLVMYLYSKLENLSRPDFATERVEH